MPTSHPGYGNQHRKAARNSRNHGKHALADCIAVRHQVACSFIGSEDLCAFRKLVHQCCFKCHDALIEEVCG